MVTTKSGGYIQLTITIPFGKNQLINHFGYFQKLINDYIKEVITCNETDMLKYIDSIQRDIKIDSIIN